MKNKTEISGNYMEEMKNLHAHKTVPLFNRQAIITGHAEENIGGTIEEKFENNGIDCYIYGERADNMMDQNVRSEIFDNNEADILVVNQGYTSLNWVEHQPQREIQHIVDSCLTSVILTVSDFVANTIDQPFRKKIVIIGSMGGKAVLNGSSPYCAAKAGVIHFAKCVAWELAPKGFDVFCVNPSNVSDGPMTQDTIKGLMAYRGLDQAEATAYWGASCPKEDFLTMCQVADVVFNLIQPDMEYMSGCSVDLAGGQR